MTAREEENADFDLNVNFRLKMFIGNAAVTIGVTGDDKKIRKLTIKIRYKIYSIFLIKIYAFQLNKDSLNPCVPFHNCVLDHLGPTENSIFLPY